MLTHSVFMPVRSYRHSRHKHRIGIMACALRVNRSSGKGRASPSGVVLASGRGVLRSVDASQPGIEPVCAAVSSVVMSPDLQSLAVAVVLIKRSLERVFSRCLSRGSLGYHPD